jgi:hypothetical protein
MCVEGSEWGKRRRGTVSCQVQRQAAYNSTLMNPSYNPHRCGQAGACHPHHCRAQLGSLRKHRPTVMTTKTTSRAPEHMARTTKYQPPGSRFQQILHSGCPGKKFKKIRIRGHWADPSLNGRRRHSPAEVEEGPLPGGRPTGSHHTLLPSSHSSYPRRH